MNKRAHGFTIVELLIVIVVIAILAAISIVAYSGVQQRARVSGTVSAIRSIEKALKLKMAEDGVSAWWVDNALTGSGNPDITSLTTSTSIKNYLQVANTPIGSTTTWFYDNDGDTYNGCSVSNAGVNLIIRNQSANVSLWEAIDKEMDDGNLSCGKLRYNAPAGGGEIYWGLAASSSG